MLDREVGLARIHSECAADVPPAREARVEGEGAIDQRHLASISSPKYASAWAACTRTTGSSLATSRAYVDTWATKHKGEPVEKIPEMILEGRSIGRRPAFPEFPEDLDPADSEFENGLLEYYQAAYLRATHDRYTLHFATAIRSTVTARQIDTWIREHPDAYRRWKAGQKFDSPTFLDDETAAKEAERAWGFVGRLFQEIGTSVISNIPRQFGRPRPINRLYEKWEDSVL